MRISSAFVLFSTFFYVFSSLSYAETTLNVHAYSSFVGKWGPGPKLKELFEKSCQCKINFVANENSGSMLSRLRLEGKKSSADVVVGIDQISLPEALKSKLFCKAPTTVQSETYSKMLDNSGHFAAYDYGYFTFMYDSRKITNPPTSVKDLLSSKDYKGKIIIEDPRTSAPGIFLLSYLKEVYGKDFPKALKGLKQNTLTTAKGWSEAYGLFTKGEAPIVWSYTTSEGYHVEIDKVTHFKGMRFKEGHPIQIEGAGVTQTACQKQESKALAHSFLEFLQSPAAQVIIAESNWMYPIKNLDGVRYASFKTLSLPDKILQTAKAEDRKQWIDTWVKQF